MKILIVSGFLGAGKTTFIRELIRRSRTAPVVLENEYGDNTIDARELRQTEAEEAKQLEILEFMEGCVCCTMKDSFVNSVLTVFSGLSPEYLIVEPTGVGKLSNILSNLQPILRGDISLLKSVVILSPGSFRRNMSEWPELYGNQIAHAGTLVFSKCENESPDILRETEEAVRALNPTAEIISRHYSKKEDAWFRSLLELPSETEEILPEAESGASAFAQITIRHPGLYNPTELILLLEDCLRGELGHIARAKGTVHAGSEALRFDLADGLYALSGSPDEVDQCVFIGTNLKKDELCRRMGTSFAAESLKPDSIALKKLFRREIPDQTSPEA